MTSFSDSISKNRIFFLSLVPLGIIILNESFKLYFFKSLSKENHTALYINVWIGLQVVFPYLLGLLSDAYCRKKVLILAVVSSFFSLVLLESQYTLAGVILDGTLGAATPIAQAAYCDVHSTNNRRPNIGNTFIAIGIPWVFLSPINDLHLLYKSLVVASIGLIALTWQFFYDFRDEGSKKLSFTFPSLKIEYGWILISRIIIAFILTNSSWNLLQYYFEENLKQVKLSKQLFLDQGIAFLLGTIVARISKIDIKRMIALVFVLISVTSTLILINSKLFFSSEDIFQTIFLVFSFLGGIGLPLIYGIFGEKIGLHEQGMLYGILSCLQTITELIGPMLLLLIESLRHPFLMSLFVIVSTYISVGLTINFLIRKKA